MRVRGYDHSHSGMEDKIIFGFRFGLEWFGMEWGFRAGFRIGVRVGVGIIFPKSLQAL